MKEGEGKGEGMGGEKKGLGKKRDEGSKSEKEVGEKKREGRKVRERKIREGGRVRHTLLTSCHCSTWYLQTKVPPD